MRVVVSGGLGALGRSVGRRLVQDGFAVALVDLAPAAGEDVAGCTVLPQVDLTDPEQARAAVAAAEVTLGGVDAVVNIAGGFVFEPLAEASAETLKRLFAMNVLTAFNLSVAAAGKLSRGGRIINIGAAAVGSGGVGMGPYTAAKAAVMELTRCHAAELAPRGVSVNALLPSIIDTAANRAAMPAADRSNWVAPEAIAEVIAFLLSPASAAITGALIPITGGGAWRP